MPLQFHAALMVGWSVGCERFRLFVCVCGGGGGGLGIVCLFVHLILCGSSVFRDC